MVKPTASFKRANRVKGSVVLYFVIKPLTPGGCYMSPVSDVTYNAKERKPSVKVYTADGKKMSGKQYYVEYENNINAGTARITVMGKNNVAGLLCTQSFIIKPQDIGKTKLNYRYDKAVGKFAFFNVTYGNMTLRERIDYTLSEEGPDSKGRYTVTVTALPGRSFEEKTTKSMRYKK